jgi:type I restriction enzyme S subunit
MNNANKKQSSFSQTVYGRDKPEIRFAGFTDAWERRKLGEVLVWSRGSDLAKAVLNENGEGDKVIHYADLYKFPPVISDVIHWSNSGEGTVVPDNSLLFPMSDVTPDGLARTTTIKKSGVKAGGDVIIGTINENYSAEFVSYQVNAHSSRILPLVTGTTVRHISSGALGTLDVSLPSKAEQVKIATVFNGLSAFIAFHQREHEKLQNIKKALLEKMFPKDGEDKPEIRFAGFTDAWEQRKLGDMAQSFEYGLNAAAMEYDGENKYLRITDIDDETHAFKTNALTTPDVDLSKAENYQLQNGDVLFARTGASVGKAYRYKDLDGLVYFAGFLIRARIKPEYDFEFVFQNTLTEKYNRYITITSQRSGQPGVNAQEYAEYKIAVPKLDEQRKIGAFFTNLDHLITLHQRELVKLKNIKKALLEKMFV